MDLYILRHGIAAERDARKYPVDDLRPLTSEGRKKIKRIASALKLLDYKFDLILTSPLVRARETAEILAAIFKAEERLRESTLLAPSGDPRRLLTELSHTDEEHILLVGHEPYLSHLISVLISGHGDSGIELKKGGFCHLKMEKPVYGRCALLLALLAPAQLTKI